MKISRHDSHEKYNITASWLREFARDIQKEGNRLDYLKDYFDSRKKNTRFNSIDEKLADIKDRVGFDLAHKISEEVSGDKRASASKIDTSMDKTAGVSSDRAIEIMQGIMDYASDMIEDQSGLNSVIVLDNIKCVDGLCFDEIKSRLNLDKFMEFLDYHIEQKNEKEEAPSYVPMDPSNMDDANDKADYYNHAEPSAR